MRYSRPLERLEQIDAGRSVRLRLLIETEKICSTITCKLKL